MSAFLSTPSNTNSAPHIIYYFCDEGDWIQAFLVSSKTTSSTLNAAYSSAIWILSLGKNPAYSNSYRFAVLCSSNTQRSFVVKSILTSNTICPVTFFHPTGIWRSWSRISKAILKLFISLQNPSHQNLSLFLLSIYYKWSTHVLFWSCSYASFLTLDLIEDMMI